MPKHILLLITLGRQKDLAFLALTSDLFRFCGHNCSCSGF